MAIDMYKTRKKKRKKNTDNIKDLRHRMITIRNRQVIYDSKTTIFFLSRKIKKKTNERQFFIKHCDRNKCLVFLFD